MATQAATAAPSQFPAAQSSQTEPAARGRPLNPFARPAMPGQQQPPQLPQAEATQSQQASLNGSPQASPPLGPQASEQHRGMPMPPLGLGARPDKPIGAPRSLSKEGPGSLGQQGGLPVRREMTWGPGGIGGACTGGSGQIPPGPNPSSGQATGNCLSGRPLVGAQPTLSGRGYEGPSPGRGYEGPSPRLGDQSQSPIRNRYLPQSPVSPLRPAMQNASSLSAPGPPGVAMGQVPGGPAMPEWSFGYQQLGQQGGPGSARPRAYSPINMRY